MKISSLREQLFKTRRDAEATNARQVETEVINSIAFITLVQTGAIDEVTAAEHIDLFAEWQPDMRYAVGAFAVYEGKLYKCVQAHTSQATWNPADAASLWSKAGDPTVEYPDWSQPIGAYDAYAQGDKVTHSGKQWISTVDNNVWTPGVYGWNEAV